MKKFYQILAFVLLSCTAYAQTNVHLQINHRLGAGQFQLNTPANNNNGVAFDVTRLQYYLSQITLIHDGGQNTLVPNTWFLIDAQNGFSEFLGSFNITNLEAIQFGVGVEAAVNHDDPVTWPSTHPLFPQSPSMHWGWAAGYRFVCMEGNSGSTFSQVWQIHALEDDYYYLPIITTTGFNIGGDLYITLDANYEEALRNIDVSTGPITHGGFGEAISLLQNFRDHVFTPATVVGLEGSQFASALQVTPHPSIQGDPVKVVGEFTNATILNISDISGRVLQTLNPNSNSVIINNMQAGLYFVQQEENGQMVATQKLLILN